MSKKAISISLAKVDYNLGRPHIYVIADCPTDYEFWRLELVVHMLHGGSWESLQFDLSNYIAGDKHMVLNLPVDDLPGVEGPAIYRLLFKAAYTGGEECIPDIIDQAYMSDIYGVYRNMLHGLMDDNGCENVSDDVIKQFLMLYAHQQAMAEGDLDVAKELFKLIHFNFSKCGRPMNPHCGCDRHVKPNNCGCHDRHK